MKIALINGDLNIITVDGVEYRRVKEPEQPKSNVPERWEDLKNITGYYVSGGSEINEIDREGITNEIDKNVFTTAQEAAASLAWSQLTQLRDATNGCPVEEIKEGYGTVLDFDEGIVIDYYTDCYKWPKPTLLFKNKRDAEDFVDLQKELILKASKLTL